MYVVLISADRALHQTLPYKKLVSVL